MQARELHRALDRGEFRLHFQPVVCGATGRMLGAEALVRWEHATRGVLLPGDFLGAAEAAGLMAPIGEWVVAEAIAERAGWPDGTFVSVNLSPAELATAASRDLVGQIERACGRAGVATSDVWVEVTEQPIIEVETTTAVLTALRDAGVRIVLDDFGSGCASLARLRTLPFEICKLDRSFVTGLAAEGGAAVVRSVVAMLRTFGMCVVAEGVETAEERALLDDIGCDMLQGYHLARPVPAAAIRSLLDGPRDGLVGAAGGVAAVAAVARHREFAALAPWSA